MIFFLYFTKKTKRVAGQFAFKFKKEACCWTHQLNKEDYGEDNKYWVLLAVEKQ